LVIEKPLSGAFADRQNQGLASVYRQGPMPPPLMVREAPGRGRIASFLAKTWPQFLAAFLGEGGRPLPWQNHGFCLRREYDFRSANSAKTFSSIFSPPPPWPRHFLRSYEKTPMLGPYYWTVIARPPFSPSPSDIVFFFAHVTSPFPPRAILPRGCGGHFLKDIFCVDPWILPISLTKKLAALHGNVFFFFQPDVAAGRLDGQALFLLRRGFSLEALFCTISGSFFFPSLCRPQKVPSPPRPRGGPFLPLFFSRDGLPFGCLFRSSTATANFEALIATFFWRHATAPLPALMFLFWAQSFWGRPALFLGLCASVACTPAYSPPGSWAS